MTLKELREKNGLSLAGIAGIIGVSRQSVHQWECGASLPTLDKLPMLENAYGDGFIDALRETMKEHGRWNKE
jgi:transcriptional regulator with XRE-family HTH domain